MPLLSMLELESGEAGEGEGDSDEGSELARDDDGAPPASSASAQPRRRVAAAAAEPQSVVPVVVPAAAVAGERAGLGAHIIFVALAVFGAFCLLLAARAAEVKDPRVEMTSRVRIGRL